MECITLIGIAVSKEMFHADAIEVMECLAQSSAEDLDPDDPQITCVAPPMVALLSVLLTALPSVLLNVLFCVVLTSPGDPQITHLAPPLLALLSVLLHIPLNVQIHCFILIVPDGYHARSTSLCEHRSVVNTHIIPH